MDRCSVITTHPNTISDCGILMRELSSLSDNHEDPTGTNISSSKAGNENNLAIIETIPDSVTTSQSLITMDELDKENNSLVVIPNDSSEDEIQCDNNSKDLSTQEDVQAITVETDNSNDKNCDGSSKEIISENLICDNESIPGSDNEEEPIVLLESDPESSETVEQVTTGDVTSAIDLGDGVPGRIQVRVPSGDLLSKGLTSSKDVEILSADQGSVKKLKVVVSKKQIDSVISPIKNVNATVRECCQCNKTLSCTLELNIGNSSCFICSEKCLVENRFAQKASLQRATKRSVDIIGKSPERFCAQCKSVITPCENTLSWETMDFCNEECLKLFQNSLGQNCSYCNKHCHDASLGKYTVRFGFEIKQFCQSSCLEDFKKGLKVCSYCQADMPNGNGVMVPVNYKPHKDFCSNECMNNYDKMSNNMPIQLAVNNCCVCNKLKVVTVEVLKGTKQFNLCSDICFSSFKYVNPIIIGFCDMCKKYFDHNFVDGEFTIFHEETVNMFCSKTCVNVFVLTKRKIVQCNWCKVKKYNFDMIKKIFSNKQVMMFCSFCCFSMWKQSPKKNTCDHCNKFVQIMYHLGMSDGTLRSFCGHECLMKFQLQFRKVPVTPASARPMSPVYHVSAKQQPQRTTVKRIQSGPSTVEAITVTDSPVSSESIPILRSESVPTNKLPVISNVVTLDQEKTDPRKGPSKPSLTQSTVLVKHQILVAPPRMPAMLNKQTMFSTSPMMKNKGITCVPITHSKNIQTDLDNSEIEAPVLKEIGEFSNIVPVFIPVVVKVPVPLPMFSIPVPTPIPIPVPVPVPIFVPTKDVGDSAVSRKRRHSVEEVTESGARRGNEEEGEGSKRKRLNSGSDERGRSEEGGERSGGGHEGSGGGSGGSSGSGPNSTKMDCTNKKYLKHMFGVNAWKQWVAVKNEEISKGTCSLTKPFNTDLLQLTSQDLSLSLSMFIREFKKPSGKEYTADVIYYLCLGIQDYLQMNGRIDNIFTDPYYEKFTDCLDEVIAEFHASSDNYELVLPRIEEEHLWESKQLGPHSPYSLLFTLMFFNTKYFLLKTVESHIKLSFSHIMKHWKRNSNGSDGATKNMLLRYYPPSQAHGSGDSKDGSFQDEKKRLEQHQDVTNPFRCPVFLYEYYLSKCVESVKTRNDLFYLEPERSSIPDSPVWYSTKPVDTNMLSKMFNRLKLVKEINLAILSLE